MSVAAARILMHLVASGLLAVMLAVPRGSWRVAGAVFAGYWAALALDVDWRERWKVAR